MTRFKIHGDNLTIADTIRNYIEEKAGKLERYFNNASSTIAHARVKAYSNSTTKIEVIVLLKGVTPRAEEGRDDLYAGIGLTTNKLGRQVRKYKARVNRKHRDRGDQDIFVAEVQESTANNHADDIESENDIGITRSKQFSLKLMDSEEAVLQVDLLGHGFSIFIGRETGGTSIIYRRKDGKYGLTEATE